MSSTKTDHYFRLMTLLQEGPRKTLLEFLLKQAGCLFSNLDTYLNSYQSLIKNSLPRYQYHRLFGPGTKIEKNFFDISLSCILLTKLFTLSNQEKQWISDIKDIRNDLNHRCDLFEINETDFMNMWRIIMDATKGLAGQISQSYLQEITEIIEDVKQILPGTNTEKPKDWWSTTNGKIYELKDKITEPRDGMKTLQKSSEKGTSILEKAVHVYTGEIEPARKRMKILYPDLEQMQDGRPSLTLGKNENDVFKTLQDLTKLYIKYNDSQGVSTERFEEAKTKLRQHKMLAIIGPRYSGKTSLATKLMANYSPDRQVHLLRPSDMRYVRLGDLSILLVEDFAGKFEPNKQKAIEWYDVFDVLLHVVQSGKLSVIIVSEADSFRKCEIPTHGLLRHYITLTSLKLPVIKPEPGLDLATDITPRHGPYNDENKGTSFGRSKDGLAHGNFAHTHTESDCRVQGVDYSKLIVTSARSICLIHYPKGHGSGFRIGSPGMNLILTADHVLKQIRNYSGPPPFEQHSTIQQENNLDSSDVWCVFNHDTDEYQEEEKDKFYFKTVVHFNDLETDTAILELKPSECGTPMPTSFTRWCKPKPSQPFYLIGHPEGGKKKSCLTDLNIIMKCKETSDHLMEIRRWCNERNVSCEPSDNHRLDNPARWLFHVPENFMQGASGCPGLIFNPPHRVNVVTVFLGGYPNWFYDERATRQHKAKLPIGYRVEQGADFCAVLKNIKAKKRDLYNLLKMEETSQ